MDKELNKLYDWLKNINQLKKVYEFPKDNELNSYIEKNSRKDTITIVITNYNKLLDDFSKYRSISDNYVDEFYDMIDNLKDKVSIYSWVNKNYFLLIKLYIPLLLYASVGFNEINLDDKDIELFIKEIEIRLGGKNIFYFRGQSNFDYSLIPSMYRSINLSKNLIDDDVIEEMYREAGLISKYEAVYGNKPKMNYDFFSMMQHFVSYSPLIDFSENINIATVFATKRLCNFNDYDCTDGALFLLAKNDNLNHNNNIKRSISIHRGKVRYNSIIKGKPLYLCAISDFIPVFEIHDKKTSDRMRYQQGVFVDFKQAVFINGILLFPGSMNYLFKVRIYSKNNNNIINKQTIYEHIIRKYKQFEYEYLMNPYLFFEK